MINNKSEKKKFNGKIIKFLQDISICTLFTIEILFISVLFIDVTKIPILDFDNIISLRNSWVLAIPLIVICISEELNKASKKNKIYYIANEIKNGISYILFSVFISFFMIRTIIISWFVANGLEINANNIEFNRILLVLLITICFIIIISLKEKTIQKETLIVLMSKCIIEANIITFIFLYAQICVYFIYPNQILFNVIGIIEAILFVIIILFESLINKNYSIASISKLLNALQTLTAYICIYLLFSIQFKSLISSSVLSVLSFSFSAVLTVLLYWSDFEKVFGDIFFGLIMGISSSFPIIAYLIYRQTKALGETNFSRIMFGLILAVGAILLLIVSEDAQIINGIGLSNKRVLSNYEKQKIAKYKLELLTGL